MFSRDAPGGNNRLLIIILTGINGVIRNSLKCSEIRCPNYTFVVSNKNEITFTLNKIHK